MNTYRITITLRRTTEKPIPAEAQTRIEGYIAIQIADIYDKDVIEGVQVREIKRRGPVPQKAPVNAIKRLDANGYTVRAIAEKLAISKSMVHRVLHPE